MKHEQCASNEVFIGNTDSPDDRLAWFHERGLSSCRLGDVALCIEGKPLPKTYAPLFIDRSQENAHHAIMMRETFGEHWHRSYR